jgi:hypothetical protein
MNTSTIQLPATFVPDLIAQVSALWSNFSGLIILILSILTIALVLDILFGAIRHK